MGDLRSNLNTLLAQWDFLAESTDAQADAAMERDQMPICIQYGDRAKTVERLANELRRVMIASDAGVDPFAKPAVPTAGVANG